MNRLKYLLMLVIMVFVFGACDDDDPNTDISVISLEKGEKNDFDKYLENILTEPYNIQFLYKWEDVESDMNYQLVPATYENSIKMANLVKYLCLDSYEEVAPSDFLKKYFPKMFMMVGSAAYRNNGTMVLGTAEGGLKITLYNINNLDVTNVEMLYEMYFRTIFHEFSHILHQTKDYTTDFDKISSTDYVGGSWNDAWDGKSSLDAGFISDYSSKEPNEDFVELIAHYITNTEASWAAKLEPASDSGKAKLTQKMTIVKSYMKEVWNIDMDELRTAIATRAEKLDEQDLDNITIE
ncbi:putative zinc-binding metallopeptidase [Marinifilum sp. D714]|uniref:zinc-binding metallopeptidase n=1 Tax=Marinifilum sp. D714 TaxID=2937523 RepID=UPI0027CE905F|nr:putative zinc-binding metallopeptidase [Marinifilum sp. D714]MDQ2178446.1 putative zinc-binding metallopeptidase [Marinifilum sp. D714]